MPARDYSAPQLPPLAVQKFTATPNQMSSRRRIRMQAQTDLYVELDSYAHPQHQFVHCSAVYELEDRSRPSISSF